jgi:hypothetical protein
MNEPLKRKDLQTQLMELRTQQVLLEQRIAALEAQTTPEPKPELSIVQHIIQFIEEFGDTDGAHHKQWALDQIVRIALETDEAYKAWRGERVMQDYGWDEGIAP